jgi:hypothetical protein
MASRRMVAGKQRRTVPILILNARPDAGSEAVPRVVHELDSLIVVADALDANDGAEGFFLWCVQVLASARVIKRAPRPEKGEVRNKERKDKDRPSQLFSSNATTRRSIREPSTWFPSRSTGTEGWRKDGRLPNVYVSGGRDAREVGRGWK